MSADTLVLKWKLEKMVISPRLFIGGYIMQELMSVDNYLEVAADRGMTRASVRISSERKRADLLEEGCTLKLIRGSRFLVSWDDVALDQDFLRKAVASCDMDIDEFFKAHPELNQAQRLWLMSSRANSSLFDSDDNVDQ